MPVDRNEFLPTAHGFDEFYGNLHHLNAKEEPELPDYPKPTDFPNFARNYGPRGVVHSFASDIDDPTIDPRFGRVGRQKIEDTGPLDTKRMQTIDDDIAARAVEFLRQQVGAGKPVFLWVNFTHMHFRTHAKPQSVGQAGRWQAVYHDVMIDHDRNVGAVLDALDQLGIADNTIVMYGSDNGPHVVAGCGNHLVSAARKTPTGRAPIACRLWCAGPGRSKPAVFPTRSWRT
jgi:arylsulfatase